MKQYLQKIAILAGFIFTLYMTGDINIATPDTVTIEQEQTVTPFKPFKASIERELTKVDEPEAEVESIETVQVATTQELPYSEEEIDLIALVTMAEAEGECEEGQRLVIDSILNRVESEHFPDTVHDVIYQKNQYSCVWCDRINRCYVRDDIKQLVIEEIQNRYNSDVVFFRTNHYHSFGTPVMQVGAHYFSKY